MPLPQRMIPLPPDMDELAMRWSGRIIATKEDRVSQTANQAEQEGLHNGHANQS